MQKYLVPKKDVLVRDPFSLSPLPDIGAFVDWSGSAGRFWRRRVKQGDCDIAQPPVKEIVEEIVEEVEQEEISDEPLQPKRKRGK